MASDVEERDFKQYIFSFQFLNLVAYFWSWQSGIHFWNLMSSTEPSVMVSKQLREILLVYESSLGILFIVPWWLSQLSLFKIPWLFADFPLIKRTLPWPVEHKIRYSISFQPPLTAILSTQNSVALTQSCFQNVHFPWLKHLLDLEEFFPWPFPDLWQSLAVLVKNKKVSGSTIISVI